VGWIPRFSLAGGQSASYDHQRGPGAAVAFHERYDRRQRQHYFAGKCGCIRYPGFFVQALADTGTVEVTATAPGYAAGTRMITFTPSSTNATFDPLAAGVTDLSITQPIRFETPANVNTQITATVTAPTFSNFGSILVGDDLQTSRSVFLGATPPVPTDITLTVADPSIAVLSDNVSIAGSVS